MTIRIGWTRDRPKPRGGKIAGGLYLTEIVRVRDDHGTHWVLGYLTYARHDLERLAERRVVLDVRVIGVLRFEDDVTPASIDRALGKIRVTGRVIASSPVKAALAARLGAQSAPT